MSTTPAVAEATLVVAQQAETTETPTPAAVALVEPSPAVKPTESVVVRRDYTLGLFESDRFLNDDRIARAFGVKAILNKDGEEVGHRYGGKSRRDIAKETGLTRKEDKDKLDNVIRESQEHYLKLFKAWFVMQPDGALGISRYAYRKDKNGIGTHTVAFRELPDKVKADLQKLADAYKIPVEKLAEFIESLKGKETTIEVQATKVESAPEQPKPEETKPAEPPAVEPKRGRKG